MRFGGRWRRDFGFGALEGEGEAGVFSGDAFNFDIPLHLLHHAVADAETESHAFAHFFRGVKRIKNLRGLFLGDPHARIGHDHTNGLPAQFGKHFDPFLRAAMQGVDAVLDKIDEHL